MTPATIQAGELLIREYMGWEDEPVEIHTQWHELMEVFCKINEKESFVVTIVIDRAETYLHRGNSIIGKSSMQTFQNEDKKLELFEAIVSAIQYINARKSKAA